MGQHGLSLFIFAPLNQHRLSKNPIFSSHQNHDIFCENGCIVSDNKSSAIDLNIWVSDEKERCPAEG